MRGVLSAFYSHPWAWNEIGYGGPAYPRGYMRLGEGQREPHQAAEAGEEDPVRAVAAGGARMSAGDGRDRASGSRGSGRACWRRDRSGPADNDSRFLLDPHRRGLPNLPRMARYRDDDEVDLVVVGAGAGGSTLAQRLARRGWRIVVLESGPFWDPDRDWVSDEAGSSKLYWNEPRVIGGEDPVELGKNNSGHGVGGSMIHYAGYAPRFHPSDFRTRSLDGVGADWPISYDDLKPHYERVEAELPVAGPGLAVGRPARLPVRAASDLRRRAARARGRARGGDRDARRAGRDRQRRVRQPPALHLPRLLPAGLQGQRQGLAAGHPPARRDRARRRDPRRLPRRARSRSTARPRARRRLSRTTAACACSAPPRSRSPATRSRRRGCCCTRPARASRTGSATRTTRSAAT